MVIRAAIYSRTSPDCPLSADDQIARMRAVAAECCWTVKHVLSDRPTSVKKGQERRIGELALIDAIRNGAVDKVMICGIDRIGKSLIDLVGFLETCRTAGVSLWVDEQKLDTASSNGLSLFDVTGMLAVHLRQSRRDRILRGQAAARALSIRFGRPPLGKPKVEKAKQLLVVQARLCGRLPDWQGFRRRR